MIPRAIATCLLFLLVCRAQTAEFEVASIKPMAPPGAGMPLRFGSFGGPGTNDPGRFTCTGCSIMMLITFAYDVQRYQVSGPETINTEVFEIAAKIPAGANRAEFRHMLQNLLADRFKLKLHRESKETQIYKLVVAKNGPKLKESSAAPESIQEPLPPGQVKRDAEGYPVLPAGRSVMAMAPGRARVQGARETMAQLANRLSLFLSRPVTDATGLSGKYDYVLSFAPEMGRGLGLGLPPAGGPPPASSEDSGPTIFAALQEQLGLKLEPNKGPVDLLVIDHVEKVPTEN